MLSNPFKIQTQAEMLYYDIQIANYSNSASPYPSLVFIENRNIAFLSNAQDYMLSIVRFQLDTCSLPLFSPQIDFAQKNIDKTLYSVKFSYNGITKSRPVMWKCPDDTITPPFVAGDDYNGYYDCFSYQWFIDILNDTLRQVFEDLTVSVGLAQMPTTHAPFLIWDTSTNSAVLNCDVKGFESNKGLIDIFFNNCLFNLFSSFPAVYIGTEYVRILVSDNRGGANTIILPMVPPGAEVPLDTYFAVQVIQEYSTVSMFTPISSIIFTSNSLPIVSTQHAEPQVYNNSRVLGTQSGANYSQMITDMIGNDCLYKPVLIYQPFYPRLIDMYGMGDLKTIDIAVSYKTKLGRVIPFKLGAGCSASIKILFQRKK